MKIAVIIGSNSHIDYVARVAESERGTGSPTPDDHGFGRFVSVSSGGEQFVGVIYDSRLFNPEFSGFGPRLDPKPALDDFDAKGKGRSGILIGIIVLGRLLQEGKADQSVPARTIPVDSEVTVLSDELIRKFHVDDAGKANISYFSRIMSHSGQLAVPLMENIVQRISPGFDDGAKERLDVLLNSLKWQRTMTEARF
ncbi:MAG: hypothetical protein KF685_11360 [Acidobacteria bacterium]|nr:hypothetical protein [Acidobacteriota bacterium]